MLIESRFKIISILQNFYRNYFGKIHGEISSSQLTEYFNDSISTNNNPFTYQSEFEISSLPFTLS